MLARNQLGDRVDEVYEGLTRPLIEQQVHHDAGQLRINEKLCFIKKKKNWFTKFKFELNKLFVNKKN